ncbi:3-oxoacyl-[acyl-carrier protein] reductase [Bacillus oleivorans]|uniref:3-oxoacyl-[acyl-carrier protein] reductase n=1 Tax=Bacillus oleivorans TaxID=1448271 RepID=A0A285CV55_9BACI|nr:SDR family oxidoreductase [Bacillus oleivorans]SNX70906.1 3-oxoacyl-[acyl-carrier protein] reductase [Bacillus oleivorans]
MNKIAIITGASRLQGIGAAICRALAGQQMDIFFTYWSPYDQEMEWGIKEEEPSLLQKEILQFGVRCEKMELNLAVKYSHQVLLDEVESKLGPADVLVNNAAYSTSSSFKTLDEEELLLHYLVNVKATSLVSCEFAKRFSKGQGGRIINLTSGQSLAPMPGELAYATTKGAIEALTTTLSAEVAEKGITVNAVNPGPTDTGWMSADLKRQLTQKFPRGRVGVPQDVANLVSFLASEQSEWITGQVIHSEGGFMRG